ncbi:hypothetical protein [Alloactinosynnema sp. L-07]|uniref:DUF4386 domain-containing protein n=1 Tax=Alloactinosynnema sp. L-07 TaxID=1653480 RepID=UPI00065F0460|nr:DUF4386 domain-containing protein [Alloactinosynnema sp. L-07]CRK57737.1 hypothetical protein [Alloactinosynnema sp. L-07]
MSHRRIAVLVGLLFISSTITFSVGSGLLKAYFSSPSPDGADLLVGVLLEVYTGLAVAAIGVALRPVLTPFGARLATGYLGLRLAECTAIVAFGAYFLMSHNNFRDYDLIVYTLAAAGGLALCTLLLRSGLTPRWLSLAGLAGYAILLLGVVVDLLGITDLDSDAGFAFFIPGGLFELAFPLLLIIKGFTPPPVENARSHVGSAGRAPQR